MKSKNDWKRYDFQHKIVNTLTDVCTDYSEYKKAQRVVFRDPNA